jgi:uncharacterized Zn finger protein (UPF0148 family)
MIAHCPRCGGDQVFFGNPKYGDIRCRHCGLRNRKKVWSFREDQITTFQKPLAADEVFITADKIPRGNFAKEAMK